MQRLDATFKCDFSDACVPTDRRDREQQTPPAPSMADSGLVRLSCGTNPVWSSKLQQYGRLHLLCRPWWVTMYRCCVGTGGKGRRTTRQGLPSQTPPSLRWDADGGAEHARTSGVLCLCCMTMFCRWSGRRRSFKPYGYGGKDCYAGVVLFFFTPSFRPAHTSCAYLARLCLCVLCSCGYDDRSGSTRYAWRWQLL